jgi:hypothetical protein
MYMSSIWCVIICILLLFSKTTSFWPTIFVLEKKYQYYTCGVTVTSVSNIFQLYHDKMSNIFQLYHDKMSNIFQLYHDKMSNIFQLYHDKMSNIFQLYHDKMSNIFQLYHDKMSGMCCFSSEDVAHRNKSKDWLAWNQDNVFE